MAGCDRNRNLPYRDDDVSTESQIIDAIRDVIAAIVSPRFDVRIGVFDPGAVPARTVCIAPVDIDPEPAGGTMMRNELSVILLIVSRVESASGDQHAFTTVCDDNRTVLKALRTSLGGIGVEQLIRGRTEYWYPHGGQSGQPAATFTLIRLFFLED